MEYFFIKEYNFISQSRFFCFLKSFRLILYLYVNLLITYAQTSALVTYCDGHADCVVSISCIVPVYKNRKLTFKRSQIFMYNIAFSLFLFRNLLFAACQPNPCINGGTCQLDVDSPDGFVCKCPPKFSGSKCESKIYPVLLIKYHMSGTIMSEANVKLILASFRNNSLIHLF